MLRFVTATTCFSISVCFLVAVIKYSDKSDLEEKGYFSSQFQVTAPHFGKSWRQEAETAGQFASVLNKQTAVGWPWWWCMLLMPELGRKKQVDF